MSEKDRRESYVNKIVDAAEALVADWKAGRPTHGGHLRVAVEEYQAIELRTNAAYRIHGLGGLWEIRGMATIDMGDVGPVELQLYRIETRVER